ncbi:MAG: PhoU domain-containing protein [Candidatus Hodarchaeales archaeon]|jgi:phosphate uptake regulator
MASIENNRIKRRVQQVKRKNSDKPGSYNITLPKWWCEENNIRGGKLIDMIIDEIGAGTILLSIPNKKHELAQEYQLKLEDHNPQSILKTARSVLGAYLDGYDYIIITGIPKDDDKKLLLRQSIRKLSEKLFGSETIENNENFIIEISSEIKSPILLIKDMFNKSIYMFKDSITAYLKNNKKIAQDIIERDDEVDKLYFRLVRTLKILIRDPISIISSFKDEEFNLMDTIDYRMIASYLEKLGDYAENIAEIVINTSQKKRILLNNENLEEISNQIITLLETSFNNFFIKNAEKAMDLISIIRDNLFERIDQLRIDEIDNDIIRIIENVAKQVIDLSEFVK